MPKHILDKEDLDEDKERVYVGLHIKKRWSDGDKIDTDNTIWGYLIDMSMSKKTFTLSSIVDNKLRTYNMHEFIPCSAIVEDDVEHVYEVGYESESERWRDLYNLYLDNEYDLDDMDTGVKPSKIVTNTKVKPAKNLEINELAKKYPYVTIDLKKPKKGEKLPIYGFADDITESMLYIKVARLDCAHNEAPFTRALYRDDIVLLNMIKTSGQQIDFKDWHPKARWNAVKTSLFPKGSIIVQADGYTSSVKHTMKFSSEEEKMKNEHKPMFVCFNP